MVIMDPYVEEALLRFIAMLSCNGLSFKADTLIDTGASLNFVRKEFVMANGSYKGCKTIPKLSIRVASEQRISTIKMFFLRLSPLMDTNSLTCNLEFFLTLKFQILSWDCRS